MKFGDLWLKVCGDNLITWWIIDDPEDKGSVSPGINNPARIPHRLWVSEVVRFGAEAKNVVDVGLKEAVSGKMTNYELIKNMTVEEMAVTIMCPNEMGMAEIERNRSDSCNCNQCCLDWLQRETD